MDRGKEENRVEEDRLDRPRFMNIWPNSQDPITRKTFDGIDQTISDIQYSLGIDPSKTLERFYAYSKGQNGEPSIIVSCNEPRKLRLLHVSLYTKDETRHYSLRNDAGTVADPAQVAASQDIYRKPKKRERSIAQAGERTPDLSETDIAVILDILKERVELDSFEKKEQNRRYILMSAA